MCLWSWHAGSRSNDPDEKSSTVSCLPARAHILNAGDTLIKCSIWDLSDKGAARVAPHGARVPRRFDLLPEAEEFVHPESDVFPPKREKTIVVRARAVAWLSGARLGVTFA